MRCKSQELIVNVIFQFSVSKVLSKNFAPNKEDSKRYTVPCFDDVRVCRDISNCHGNRMADDVILPFRNVFQRSSSCLAAFSFLDLRECRFVFNLFLKELTWTDNLVQQFAALIKHPRQTEQSSKLNLELFGFLGRLALFSTGRHFTENNELYLLVLVSHSMWKA